MEINEFQSHALYRRALAYYNKNDYENATLYWRKVADLLEQEFNDVEQIREKKKKIHLLKEKLEASEIEIPQGYSINFISADQAKKRFMC